MEAVSQLFLQLVLYRDGLVWIPEPLCQSNGAARDLWRVWNVGRYHMDQVRL